MDAVDCGRCALVELAGDVFHGDVFLPLEGTGVGNGVRDGLSENAVTAFLEKIIGKAEKVIHVDEPQGPEMQREILIELSQQAFSLDTEALPLLHEDSFVRHIQEKCMPTGAQTWWAYR